MKKQQLQNKNRHNNAHNCTRLTHIVTQSALHMIGRY